jgi:beta-lactamase regulating signal transducer with metallopeptidase domain
MGSWLIDHLWQSTLFAIVAWLLARALRHYQARVRHWVWFAASVKFLVPFSFLTGIAATLSPRLAPDSGALVLQLRHAALSLAVPPLSGLAEGLALDALVLGGSVAWGVGCAGLLARWWVQWARVRRVVRAAVPAGAIGSLPILTSALMSEPGVAGIFRQRLLLPEGVSQRLSASQLGAVLAHERCHARRRDNLLAAVHALTEALFWFHPLVWWIGGRLVEERERACDEEVLGLGHAPQVYAEGILKICRSCVTGDPGDPGMVAGVSGADLLTRLEAIMKNDVPARLSLGKKLMLGSAASLALGLPLVVGITTPVMAHAEAAKITAAGKIELLPGRRVRLSFDHVEVRSLLRSLAEAAGVNMLVSDKVGGEITVHLAEMPWDQALNAVLKSQGLASRESDGIVVVEPAGGTGG